MYDQASRPIATLNALGYRTSTVYDAAGQKLAIIDPRGNRNSFTYDAVGRQIVRRNPFDRRLTLVFDGAGRNTLRLDARGNCTTYTYYGDGTLFWQNTVTGGGGRATFIYDAAKNRTSASDWTGRYTTSYDGVNAPLVQQYATGKRITYVYDAAGPASLPPAPACLPWKPLGSRRPDC